MVLKERIEKKQAKIGVIGLGYVGLPFIIEFVMAGFASPGLRHRYRQSRGPEKREELHQARQGGSDKENISEV